MSCLYFFSRFYIFKVLFLVLHEGKLELKPSIHSGMIYVISKLMTDFLFFWRYLPEGSGIYKKQNKITQ